MVENYILLDRDGTIIVDKHYLSDPAGVELLPGAGSGLKLMCEMGYRLVVLTNQSGVGRGYYDEAAVHACNERMLELLQPYGVTIDGIFYCIHTPEENCQCRKPAVGMMMEAAKVHGFDPKMTVMIGDKKADIVMGHNAGAKTILVRTGKGAEHEPLCTELADYVVDNLPRAATVVAQL